MLAIPTCSHMVNHMISAAMEYVPKGCYIDQLRWCISDIVIHVDQDKQSLTAEAILPH